MLKASPRTTWTKDDVHLPTARLLKDLVVAEARIPVIIAEMEESSKEERTIASSLPDVFLVPLHRSAPGSLFTGIHSPVRKDSSTHEVPLSTYESQGITWYGGIMMTSPGFRTLVGTVICVF